MSDHEGNGEDKSAVVLEFFDGRIRQIERRQDTQDAEVRADIREVREMILADRSTGRERHAELLRMMNDLIELASRRRKPKRGKR